jgi:YrbI family 3-deoxy-D-manno-octulosonate 8-phosphate phosphatase
MSGTVAIIPARGGSKRIGRKNLLPLCGEPLVLHTVRHAFAATEVGEVIVSTEDDEIAAVAESAGATVIARPLELANDHATSESALLHALDVRGTPDPELVVFLQATSPVRRPHDIDAAVRQLRESGADSLLSACRDRGLFWLAEPGGARPTNYDPHHRLREQDMPPQFRENGSIYVFRTALLRESGTRLGGRVEIYEMDEGSSVQIDEPEDVQLAEWILSRRVPRVDFPDPVDLVVLDFDGVLTDNAVLVDQDGREMVRAHRGDGWGLARLRDAGIPVAVLSTESNPVVAARCEKLRIPYVQEISDKEAGLRALLDERGARAEHTIFVGNDVNDLGALRIAGLPVVVADADPEAMRAARLVLTRRGGQGAVRELCDMLLRKSDSEAARP